MTVRVGTRKAEMRQMTQDSVVDIESLDHAKILMDSVSSSIDYKVPFGDTDAMGVVHHSNYMKYLEICRTAFLEEHDVPYTAYMQKGIHICVTSLGVEYLRPCYFNDTVNVVCWLEWVKNTSMKFKYVLKANNNIVGTAWTSHACIDGKGSLRKLPAARKHALSLLTASV